MAEYSIREIARFTDAKANIGNDCLISELCTDSRNIVYPGKALFFAIPGIRHDGHDYIAEAYKKGVRSFVISKTIPILQQKKDINILKVRQPVTSLQHIAEQHRKNMPATIIGITGSNGKTIVKEWLYQCLSPDRKITRNPKSYNSQVGVPLSLWLLDSTDELGIFEAGISQPGEMNKLEPVLQPSIGIFTNIGQAHQENFSTTDEKIIEKLTLFRSTDVLIYCKDHEKIHQNIVTGFSGKKTRLFSWSAKTEADVSITSIEKSAGHTRITIKYSGIRGDVSIPFTDEASIENSMHIISLLLFMDFPLSLIRTRMSRLTPIAMRLEQKKGIHRCTLINDSYNSDINSLTIALDYAMQQSQHSRRTLILSDILQSGLQDEELYRKVSQLIKEYGINRLIGIGPSISRHRQLFSSSSAFYNSTSDFLKNEYRHEFSDETILLKGARTFEFEKIASGLEEKLHRTVLEIDLNAMIHNLNYFQSLLAPRTKIMVMVKALGYGSGTFEIANVLQHQRVDYLSVAYSDEGVELRDAGITLPVMVMNPEESSFESMIRNNLEPEIYSMNTLNKFIHALEYNSVKKYPVHIKIDSGMHRLGFDEKDTEELIKRICNHPAISVKSVFSHLAASDDPAHDDFTLQQISIFKRIYERIAGICSTKPLRHILNSAGIERFPEFQFDMVRLGIGLHGISAGKKTKLLPVSTLKTTISQIKEIMPGETVGYNRRGKISEKSAIAVLPIGYADGLNRKLGNGAGKFYINGKFAPVTGDICMDMCMVNISGITAQEGDEVIIFGKNNPVEKMSAAVDTIPYEILTGVSSRVKRVYFKE